MTCRCCDSFVDHEYLLDLQNGLVWLLNERGGACLL